MIDGHLHVYYVIESDGRANFSVYDESGRTKQAIDAKTSVASITTEMGSAVVKVMEAIVNWRNNLEKGLTK